MKCILHIGTEKTGSTSIQAFLHANRATLMKQGIAFLSSTGEKNDLKLAFACLDDNKQNWRTRHWKIEKATDRARWREKLLSNMRAEIESLPASVHTVLLSSEHFQSRLNRLSEVRVLHNALSPMFESFQMFVYLRRQDELAVSLYSTVLRGGGPADALIPTNLPERKKLYYDYRGLMQRWSAVLGADNISCAEFNSKKFQGGDLITDFCFNIGIDLASECFNYPDPHNESLNSNAQDFLIWFNSKTAHGQKKKPTRFRVGLREYLGKHHSGKTRLPARSEAQHFYDEFREGNDSVARDYLQREHLFEENFEKYPEQRAPTASKWYFARVMIGFALYSCLRALSPGRYMDRLGLR